MQAYKNDYEFYKELMDDLAHRDSEFTDNLDMDCLIAFIKEHGHTRLSLADIIDEFENLPDW